MKSHFDRHDIKLSRCKRKVAKWQNLISTPNNFRFVSKTKPKSLYYSNQKYFKKQGTTRKYEQTREINEALYEMRNIELIIENKTRIK
jgi:uncharacterized protein YaaR (DUF327 family)